MAVERQSQDELVKLYSLCGGVPRHLELLDNYNGFDDALEGLVLRRSGLLYQEARYLLHEEISSPNTCWSILQTLGSGTVRLLNVNDDFNRESLAIEIDFSLPAQRVRRTLNRIIEWRGKPHSIRCDNGPEYVSRALQSWAN